MRCPQSVPWQISFLLQLPCTAEETADLHGGRRRSISAAHHSADRMQIDLWHSTSAGSVLTSHNGRFFYVIRARAVINQWRNTMKKMPIAIGSAMLLSLVPAFGQAPATPSAGTPPSVQSGLPTCSASDAARVRAGQTPATPCSADAAQTTKGGATTPESAPSTMPSTAPSTTSPGTTPRP